ncbi:hypothetical protein Hanom_Chr05g00436591 [Helianthus anomalus]
MCRHNHALTSTEIITGKMRNNDDYERETGKNPTKYNHRNQEQPPVRTTIGTDKRPICRRRPASPVEDLVVI